MAAPSVEASFLVLRAIRGAETGMPHPALDNKTNSAWLRSVRLLEGKHSLSNDLSHDVVVCVGKIEVSSRIDR
jgi:hypothetical protein